MRQTTANFIAIIFGLSLVAACASPMKRPKSPTSQVLFVCEHGNVKSLMAASYFNQLAQERDLPLRTISRGSAPNSNTVPAPILEGLKGDGLDVSEFHPAAVSTSDISTSRRVILPSASILVCVRWMTIPSWKPRASELKATLSSEFGWSAYFPKIFFR